jgi:hypothetical protein
MAKHNIALWVSISVFIILALGAGIYFSIGTENSAVKVSTKEPTTLSSVSSSLRNFNIVDKNIMYKASGNCNYNKEGLTSKDNCLYFVKYYPLLIVDMKTIGKKDGCNNLITSQINRELPLTLFAVRPDINTDIFSFYDDPEENQKVFVWCNTADNLMFGTTSERMVDAYHSYFNIPYRRAYAGEQ